MQLYGEEPNDKMLSNQELEAYRKFINKIPIPLIILDKDFKIKLWNTASDTKFGVSSNDAVGKPITIIFSDSMGMSESEHDKRVKKFYKEKKNTGSTFGTNREVVGKGADGSDIYFEIYTYKVVLDGEQYVCGLLCDISREKQLNQKIISVNDKLREEKRKTTVENENLNELNKDLFQAKQAAEFRMARAKSQESITNKLLFIIAALLGATLIASIFIRVPETILSFLKDSSLLLLGILSGAIGGLFGRDDKGGTGNVMNSATFQTKDGSINTSDMSPYETYKTSSSSTANRMKPASTSDQVVESANYYNPEVEGETDPRF